MLPNQSETLRLQRLEFVERDYHYVDDLRRNSNYFAPDRWFEYSIVTGDQSRLWEMRHHDGEIWSAFLARDIAREFRNVR